MLQKLAHFFAGWDSVANWKTSTPLLIINPENV